jgi:hypothetical protein
MELQRVDLRFGSLVPAKIIPSPENRGQSRQHTKVIMVETYKA